MLKGWNVTDGGVCLWMGFWNQGMIGLVLDAVMNHLSHHKEGWIWQRGQVLQ
jgi:hypothetical protein